MGISYAAERQIAADPTTVWAVLTDRDALLAGDFGIAALDGDLRAGGRLALRADSAPKQVFKLSVTRFDPAQVMVWKGGMPFGLFTGIRTFRLSPTAGGTLFAVREEFTGLMAGLIGKSMPDLQPSFDQFADALKGVAETREATA